MLIIIVVNVAILVVNIWTYHTLHKIDRSIK